MIDSRTPPRQGRLSRMTAGVRSTLAEVRRTEGDRGVATRWSVMFRHVAYLGGILVTGLLVGAYPSLGQLATQLLLVSCGLIIVSAAVASVFYPTERRNLTEQMRFFLFGVVCFPAAVLGALLSVVQNAGGGSGHAVSSSGDAVMINLAHTALPYLFWATVVVPPFIFVKMVVGLRKIHRDRTDDEEMMSKLSRQDQLFR